MLQLTAHKYVAADVADADADADAEVEAVLHKSLPTCVNTLHPTNFVPVRGLSVCCSLPPL